VSDNAYVFDCAEAIVHEYVKTKNVELREPIISHYAPMVERIARRYSGLEPFEDLLQVGFMGLLNALNLFEPAKGVRFNTYATHLVAGAIKHHLRDRTRIIREPAWLQEVRHRTNKLFAQMQQELGRPATEAEVAERAELSPELIREVKATEELFRVASLTAGPSSDDDESDDIDFAEHCQMQLSIEEKHVLEKAISELRELEQQVLLLFHFESLSQTEIATRLGISSNYVSHILRQAVGKLRSILNSEELNDRAIRRQTSSFSDEVMDDVSDCYTEAYLIARLDEECSRASCLDTAVGFVQVQFDGLDRLQQFYGAHAVEDFLRDAAAFLRDGVRRLDSVGRIGSTGFGIVLPGTGQTVSAVESRIVSRISSWLAQDSVSRAGVSVRLGTAYYPDSGRSAKALLQAVSLVHIDAEKAA
jgi:RNA polymerase sigma-B factor